MDISLQNKIVSLIPSKDLRYAIHSNNCLLSDITLLSIVWRCAPDFEARLSLLKSLEKVCADDVKAIVSREICTQINMRRSFFTASPDAVYELHIKESPDAYDEAYLCASFETAMKMIPLFYREYECKETNKARYTIKKRCVISGESPTFTEDLIGEAVFLPGNILFSVEVYDIEGYADLIPFEEAVYPRFVNPGDVVTYREYDGKIRFGVALRQDDADCDYCVIPLDSNIMQRHDFDNVYDGHEHAYAVFTEVIDLEQLPSDMKQDYLAFRKYLKAPPL